MRATIRSWVYLTFGCMKYDFSSAFIGLQNLVFDIKGAA
jgi:hypothetical protein